MPTKKQHLWRSSRPSYRCFGRDRLETGPTLLRSQLGSSQTRCTLGFRGRVLARPPRSGSARYSTFPSASRQTTDNHTSGRRSPAAMTPRLRADAAPRYGLSATVMRIECADKGHVHSFADFLPARVRSTGERVDANVGGNRSQPPRSVGSARPCFHTMRRSSSTGTPESRSSSGTASGPTFSFPSRRAVLRRSLDDSTSHSRAPAPKSRPTTPAMRRARCRTSSRRSGCLLGNGLPQGDGYPAVDGHHLSPTLPSALFPLRCATWIPASVLGGLHTLPHRW